MIMLVAYIKNEKRRVTAFFRRENQDKSTKCTKIVEKFGEVNKLL